MSTVQINLLPDVKQHYVKAERSRNMTVSIAILVAAAAFGFFLVMLLIVYGLQKKQLSDVNKDISSVTSQLKQIDNIDKVLTVQNQLGTLQSLHSQKHISSRVFSFLTQLTPVQVHIGSVSVDFANDTMVISGTADSQTSVNTYIDTLKFTTYKFSDSDTATKAFSPVVENSFGFNNGKATYALTATFDPKLFSNDNLDSQGKILAPQLTIPQQVTTRSVINDPGNTLFNGENGI